MKRHTKVRWQLIFYDVLILLLIDLLLLVFSGNRLSSTATIIQAAIGFIVIFTSRYLGNIYGHIWRYGGIQCYIRLIIMDSVAFAITFLVERFLPIEHITFARLLAIACMNLLGSLAMRMFYRYAFKCGNERTKTGRFLLCLLRIFAGEKIVGEKTIEATKISIAIIGAGRVGVSLAEELLNNTASAYTPRCFVDVSKAKVGRDIHGIPVLLEDEATLEQLKVLDIQEVVFAIPTHQDRRKKELVKILDLVENMIRLSGVQGVEIVETGLRPGEKLYEELLVKTEELDKTDNSLIFIERDTPLSEAEIARKLSILQKAYETGDDDLIKRALMEVIPIYKKPEEVNGRAKKTYGCMITVQNTPSAI